MPANSDDPANRQTVLAVSSDTQLIAKWTSDEVVPTDFDAIATTTCDEALRRFLENGPNIVLAVVCAFVRVQSGKLSARMSTVSLIRAIRGEGYEGDILAVSDDPAEQEALIAAGATAFCTEGDAACRMRILLP